MGNQLQIPGPDDTGSDATESVEQKKLGREYLFSLREMVSELDRRDSIVDLDYDFYNHVPEVSLNTIENSVGATIPERIKAFYKLTDGFELSWNYLDEDNVSYRGGRIHLYDFARVFDLWIDKLWSISVEEHPFDEDFLLSLRGFDRIEAGDDKTSDWIVVCVEEEYPTFDLFLFDEAETDFYLLNISFENYLRMLVETRGFYGWQYLFVDDELLDEARIGRVRQFFSVMERFFPDTELDFFYQKAASLEPFEDLLQG